MKFKLREYREKAGYTQEEIAKLVGKTTRTVQSWEAGISLPNADALCDLCTVLKTNPNEILGWEPVDIAQDEDKASAPIEKLVTLRVNSDGSVELVDDSEGGER